MTKVTLFRSFYEASLNGDWDVAAGMLDDDCEYVMMPTMAVSKGSSCTRLTPGACSAIILLQLVHLSDPCAVLDERRTTVPLCSLANGPAPRRLAHNIRKGASKCRSPGTVDGAPIAGLRDGCGALLIGVEGLC